MKSFWEKLKTRWGVTSNFQVAIILLVFALTGFSTLYVHNWIDILLGINDSTVFFIKLLAFTLLVLPIYTLLLFSWGVLLGQREFFSNFIKMKIGLLFKSFQRT